MDDLKAKITDAFNNFDDLKTPACLDAKTVGMFAEQKLADKDMAKAEAHIQSCLYCLSQLTEMKELLYLASEAEPVSPELEKKLAKLFSQHKQNRTE
jgi:hypothetical protein